MSDVVTLEVAELEFKRFIELNEISIDFDNKEDQAALDAEKTKIIRAIQKGSLTVNEEGEVTFTPQRSKNKDPITFHEPTGASLMAMDRKKKTEEIGKLYATMGDMARTDAKTFSNMRMSDLKICMAVTTLFLGNERRISTIR